MALGAEVLDGLPRRLPDGEAEVDVVRHPAPGWAAVPSSIRFQPGSTIDGIWTVRRARHVLTPGAGFMTEIEAAATPPDTIPIRVIR